MPYPFADLNVSFRSKSVLRRLLFGDALDRDAAAGEGLRRLDDARFDLVSAPVVELVGGSVSEENRRGTDLIVGHERRAVFGEEHRLHFLEAAVRHFENQA